VTHHTRASGLKQPGVTLAAAAWALAVLSTSALAADVEMKTESWAIQAAEFAKMAQRIEAAGGRNLLARSGVRVFGDVASPRELADGSPGVAGGAGRVMINGQPSVITFYLGGAKPIHEIGVFTCNVDTRANQDFEVRLADNSAHPGQMPKFPEAATFTSGGKILGPASGSGGFHTAFVASDSGPLIPGKADWVEFRIWKTYSSKPGAPAKGKGTYGSAAVVELEVLGDPQDVVVISAEERAKAAALRDLGNRPPYEKKSTWQETMQASREALLRWECEIDNLVMGRAGITLGSWHVIGPLPAASEEARQIERLGKVDLAKPLALKGKELPWRDCPDLKDGEMIDLAAKFGAKPGDVVFLCRTLEVEGEFAGKEGLPVGIGLQSGKLRIVGGRSALAVADDGVAAAPNEKFWSLSEKPGQYLVMAAMPVTKDGPCSLWFMIQPPMSKPGAGAPQERVAQRQRLYDKVKSDFRDLVSLTQIKWEQWDCTWVRFERKAMAGRAYFPTDWAPGFAANVSHFRAR